MNIEIYLRPLQQVWFEEKSFAEESRMKYIECVWGSPVLQEFSSKEAYTLNVILNYSCTRTKYKYEYVYTIVHVIILQFVLCTNI